MRFALIIISCCLIFVGYGQELEHSKYNFGKVKQWNNPVTEFNYTNTSGKTQYFLPIAYNRHISVAFVDPKLSPGQSTIIKVRYYTEEFGKFSQVVPIYLSTQNEPMEIEISGKILSFHADALTVCPRIDNRGLQQSPTFKHGILVIDGDTKEPVTHFEMILETKSSREVIFSKSSSRSITRENPDWYHIEIDKEGYNYAETSVYVNKYSPMTIIELFKDEPEMTIDEETDLETDDREVVPEIPVEEVITEIPDEEDSTTENKEPEDVVVITPPVEPTPVVEPIDSADFSENGLLNEAKYAYNNIIFLIDVSSSMNKPDKMPLLKYSMNEMIDVLRSDDKVSIVIYSSTAQVLISNVSGDRKDELREVINGLIAKGQSFGTEGLEMAYDLASTNFIEQGNNEVILASDGGFNSRNFKESKLYRKALVQYRLNEIRISTIGFGKAPNPLAFMEKLADRGEGDFIRIRSYEEAETILIENIMRHSFRK